MTSKDLPNDYDACWEEPDVDPTALDPVLLTFDPGRVTQKAKYMGEMFQDWPPHVDWKDHELPASLNVADLACGTGTLLMAVAA